MIKLTRKLKIIGILFALGAFPSAIFAQQLSRADSLHSRGMAFYKAGNYKSAQGLLAEAYHIYRRKAEAAIWLAPGIDYAEVLVDMGKTQKAATLLKKLLQTANARHDVQQQAQIKNDLGWLYKHRGNYKLSVKYLKEALPLAKQSQDTVRLAFINNNIATGYRHKGDFVTALKYNNKSLFYLKQLHNQRYISIALNNIAYDYESLFLFDKAQKFYLQSLKLKKQLGNVDLLSTAYNNIAVFYKKAGFFDKALNYFQKSLKYGNQTGNPEETASTLNNIGILYHALGQPQKALVYYRQSLKMKKQVASPYSIAHTERNIANRLWDLGQYQKALDYYQQALRNQQRQGNPLSIGYSLLDLVRVDVIKRKFKEASANLHMVTSIADSTQNHALQAQIARAQGNLYYSQANYGKALEAYQHSNKLSKYLISADQILILQKLAYTYNKLNDDRAITYGQRATRLIEKQRANTGFKRQFKTGYFGRYSNFYIKMAGWQLTYHHDIAEAYQWLEAGKARTLTDELAKAAQHTDASLPEQKRLQRRQKMADISVLYDSLSTADDKPTSQRLQHKINTKELQLAAYESRLSHLYADYQPFKQPETIRLSQVQKMCGDHTAILEYGITNRNLIVFFISREEVHVKRFKLAESSSPTHRSKLALAVHNFRNAIRSKAPEDSIRALSRPLYKHLIAPFRTKVQAYKNLLVVPDKFLAYVPFAALSNNGKYLLRQFNIKYTPSMTGYKWMPEPVNDGKKTLLAIANAAASQHAHTPALPFAGLEIKNIGRLFSSKNILTGTNATEKQAKKYLQQPYAYIHIAAHSIINERDPARSGIILAQKNKHHTMENDGFLRSNEIFQMNINSNLVVLSACKSGTGELVNGEGLLGLQRAFFSAGAPTVVVSLWDVYDRSTSALMQPFYRYVLKSKDSTWGEYWQAFSHWVGWDHAIPFGKTASSMRAAKLSLLNSARYHHPVYWAPFIVVGR